MPIDFLSTRQPTQSTYVVLSYLYNFFHHPDWKEDIAFKAQLLKCKLDYSLGSLKRIERLLDAIRNERSPEKAHFLSHERNQSFLFLLAFYCGEVKGRARKQATIWQDYEEFMRSQPSTQITCLGSLNPPPIPEGEFEELFVCRFVDDNGDDYNFFPLRAICERLFGEDPKASVHFSMDVKVGENEVLPECPHYLSFSGENLIAQTPASHLPYLQLLPPHWMWGDLLMEQMQKLGNLYQNGRVVWASLVQANGVLLRNDHEASCPAEVVYDATGRTPPHILQAIARELYSLKGRRIKKNLIFKQFTDRPSKDELARYGEHLTNEKTRLFTQFKLDHLTIRAASVFIWRPHLPNGIISCATFPILIAEDTQVVLPLPARYWAHTRYYQYWFAEQDKTNEQLLAEDPEETEKTWDKDSKNRETTPAFLSLLDSGETVWQGYNELLFPQVEELPMLSGEGAVVEAPEIGQWFIRRCAIQLKADYHSFYETFHKVPNAEQQIQQCMQQLQTGEVCTFNEDIRAFAKLRLFDYGEYLAELNFTEYNQKIGAVPLSKVTNLLGHPTLTPLQTAKLIRFLRGESQGTQEGSADGANTTASLYLAYLYATGKFVPQSAEEAMTCLNHAAWLGDWRAMRWLGEFQYSIPELREAILSTRLSNESAIFFKRLTNFSNATTLELNKQKQAFLNHQLAMLEIARQLFSAAVEAGHPKAKLRLEQLMQSGKIPTKPKEKHLQSFEYWLATYANDLIENNEIAPHAHQPKIRRSSWLIFGIFVAISCTVLFHGVKFVYEALNPRKSQSQLLPKNSKSSSQLDTHSHQHQPKSGKSAVSEADLAKIVAKLPTPSRLDVGHDYIGVEKIGGEWIIKMQTSQKAQDVVTSIQSTQYVFCHEPLLKSLSRAHILGKIAYYKKNGDFFYEVTIASDTCNR